MGPNTRDEFELNPFGAFKPPSQVFVGVIWVDLKEMPNRPFQSVFGFFFALGLTKIPWTFRIRSPLKLHTHPSTKFTTSGMYVVNLHARELLRRVCIWGAMIEWEKCVNKKDYRWPQYTYRNNIRRYFIYIYMCAYLGSPTQMFVNHPFLST